MKRFLFFLVVFLVLGSVAEATTLTATVVSPNGTPYASSPVTATFVPSPSGTTPNPPGVVTGTTNGSGAFSIVVTDNTTLAPLGSRWDIKVCFNGQTPCAEVVTSVSGTSLDISALLSAAATNPTSSSSVINGATTNAFGASFNVKAGGTLCPGCNAIGDAKHDNNVVLNGTTTLTSADNPWVSGDVGKLIFCVYPGTPTNGFVAGTKIQTFVGVGQITVTNLPVGGSATYQCTWATQDDTSAFVAAEAAATSALTSVDPNQGGPMLGYPSTVYCPPGGYIVSGNIFDANGAVGGTKLPWFVGAGADSCVIYPRSDTFTGGARACLMDVVNGVDVILTGFQVYGSQWGFSCGGFPFIRINVSAPVAFTNNKITSVGITNSASPIVNIINSNLVQFENNYIQNTSLNNAANNALFECDTSSGIDIIHDIISNNTVGPNLIFNSCGARNASGGQVNVEGGAFDECGTPGNGCTQVTSSSVINFLGNTIFGEPTSAGTGALYVDGTSSAYLTSANVGPFNTVTNSNGIGCANGATIYATGSHIRSGGTTGVVMSGASASCTFYDDGGNFFQRCNSTTCTNIAATQAGYTGAFSNINYVQSLATSTFNCFLSGANATTTTTTTPCLWTPPKNVGLTRFTIGVGTPAATCTTSAILELTNGTTTQTLTVTNNATQLDSGVLSPYIFTASGTQVSVIVTQAAATCGTAPANFSVNINWQSLMTQ